MGASGHSFSTIVASLCSMAMPKPTNTVLRGGASLLADDQHLGTGGSFGIDERAVLPDDERPP